VEDIERIREHLNNIRGVEPIIGSLRTIAAGGWRQALRRLEASAEYADNLGEILRALLPQLAPKHLERALVTLAPVPPRRVAMLLIASERGLCGAFNDVVLDGAEHLIAQQELESEQVLLVTLGRRAEGYFRRRGRDLLLARSLPVTRTPSLEMVQGLAGTLRELLSNGTVDAIDVVSSPYKAAITLPPVSRRWLPIDASTLPARSPKWMPPIIETDVEALFERAIDEWALVQLYRLVIESVASEQGARFRAMDAATTNLHRLIDELTQVYHVARQHAITMEMLDLVAGAGILRGPRGRQRR